MKRLFKVMLLKAIKRKKKSEKTGRKKQSNRKEQPDEGDDSSTLRQVLSEFLLPYPKV